MASEKVIGWTIFVLGWLGFIASLYMCFPISANVVLWIIVSIICILLVWLGWGLAHYPARHISQNYFVPTLRTLLIMTCIIAILYAGCMLLVHQMVLELSIAVVVLTIGCLAIMGWIQRHKIISALILLPFILGIVATIFPTQTNSFLSAINSYAFLSRIASAFVFLNPMNVIYFLCGIALLIWLIISIKRNY